MAYKRVFSFGILAPSIMTGRSAAIRAWRPSLWYPALEKIKILSNVDVRCFPRHSLRRRTPEPPSFLSMISMPARSNAIEERRQPRASLRQSRMLIHDRVLLPRNWSNRAARSALLVTASLMRLRLANNFGFAPVTKIRCCKCMILSALSRHRDLIFIHKRT